ncbi:MAG: ABC transporter permease, partial [Propionibacterium sp.]
MAKIDVRYILTTIASFILAFIVGGIVMIVSDAEVASKFSYFFGRPMDAISASWDKVSSAYSALAIGAVGSWPAITESTAQAAPLICAGLGVGLAFRAGLFNIGAQGQAIVGAILGAYVGFSFHGLPMVVHLTLGVVVGIVGGAVWGGIAGWLKAYTGAHEVIVTIMLNYIASGMLAWLLTTTVFQRPGRTDPISQVVDWSATMPRLEGTRLHLGFFLALLAAVAVWWLLDHTPLGFRIRAVGANPDASATAGMSVPRTTVWTMVIAGALAGLAGIQYA